MSEISTSLMTLGALLLIGFATDGLGKRTRLPRVTLLLVFGILIGPSVLNLLPDSSESWFPIVSSMALAIVGFLLGGKLTLGALRRFGTSVLWISVCVMLATIFAVGLGLGLYGFPLGVALLLAAIAPATDPAAVADVIEETNGKGTFCETLSGIVAVDDGWGLIAFSVLLAFVKAMAGDGAASALMGGAWELLGAIVLGAVIGFPMSMLSGRIKPGQPMMVEALGMVFLCAGVALWLDVSYLLSTMTMGLVVANFARHHERPFHEINNIEWPFMILFFILVGASLNLESLLQLGMLGFLYVILRVVGRIAGAWLGGMMSGDDSKMRGWMGVALLPQAGVALGMALVAAQEFPDLAATILPVVTGATIFFELSGPILTRAAIVQMGEATSLTEPHLGS